MTSGGVYQGTDGVYHQESGVYVGPAEAGGGLIVEDWEAGPSRLDEYDQLYGNGEVVEGAARTGRWGYRSPYKRTTEARAPPSKFETTPKPGDTWVTFIDLGQLNMNEEWQAWDIWGGTTTDRYPRYQVDLIYHPPENAHETDFRIQIRTGSDRWNIASEVESGEPRALWSEKLYAVVKKWYSQAHDTRTGARAALFDGAEFAAEMDAFTFEAYDAGTLTLSHETQCDSADHPADDGSGIIPQEPGRYGVRGSRYSQCNFDDAIILDRPA